MECRFYALAEVWFQIIVLMANPKFIVNININKQGN